MKNGKINYIKWGSIIVAVIVLILGRIVVFPGDMKTSIKEELDKKVDKAVFEEYRGGVLQKINDEADKALIRHNSTDKKLDNLIEKVDKIK